MTHMPKKQYDFYFKPFLWVWGICCLAYSFMLFQFWWGNHDWKPLIYGIKWDDGLFEARYSQHLFTVWFLNGQILPILYVILSLGFLTLLCILIANYLCLPQEKMLYIIFALVLSCSPYTFVLFHYVFITVPMMMWGSVLIGLLWLAEKKHTIKKLLLGIFGFAFTLGGYPPNISLATTLFCGRKIILYQSKKQNIKEIIIDGIFISIILAFGYAINRGIIYILTKFMGYNFQMYNMRTSSFMEAIQKIPHEFLSAFSAFENIYSDLGAFYAVFMIAICLGAAIVIMHKSPQKAIAIIMLGALALATRVAYLVSANAWYAQFRIGYWSSLGLSAVALSILWSEKARWKKNIIFALSILAIFNFINTDYEIQKSVYYKFKLERLSHKRIEDRLFYEPNFDINGSYAALNFGYPDILSHVCLEGCPKYQNEILDNTVLPADLGYVLFWDEVKNPVALKFGIWGKTFWRVTDPILKNNWSDYYSNNPQNVSYWLYMQSKPYPYKESIYVDDKYLLFNLDELFFNQNRELLATEIKAK